MEGLSGPGIVIWGDGAGGTLDYQGNPWEEILHPPVSEAGDRRQCPLQWDRQEIFPGYRVKVGLLQLQSTPKSSSRPARGQTHSLESWETPAGLSLPYPAGEQLSPHVLATPACLHPQHSCHQPICKAGHLHLQLPRLSGMELQGSCKDVASQELLGKQLLLPRPCVGIQLHHQGSFSRHWLAPGPKGLSCSPWSLGWEA